MITYVQFVEPSEEKILKDHMKKLPEHFVRRHLVLPIAEEKEKVVLAVADPEDKGAFDFVQKLLGKPIKIVLSEPMTLQRVIEQFFGKTKEGLDRSAGALAGPIDSVALMDKLMKEAFLRRASDIHLETQENTMRIRFRVDGQLQIMNMGISLNEGMGLISRTKVLSGLDIAEQRAAQDGGFSYEFPFHTESSAGSKLKIDIRVATAPTRWGERVTLRLLALETEKLTLKSLGMSKKDLETFYPVIRRPYGVILLTGPTGSGKTTTLYAALREINRPEINIMTIEDPIEYVIQGVSQLQVGAVSKATFASALRALLRHDPDVLMVGEIRDYETADIALKASQTGHLVFSTLHTNSAVSAITRLMDIGCERYLIGSSLTAVIAQKLVRRLCPKCKRPRKLTSDEQILLKTSDALQEIYEPGGCVHCLQTGFRGRIGIFEVLWLDDEIKKYIINGKSEQELQGIAVSKGMMSLREDGHFKILEGLTSFSEIMSITVCE